MYSDDTPDIGLICAFRVNSVVRQEILETTLSYSLPSLAKSGVSLSVIDASPEEFKEKNKSFFDLVDGLKINYEFKKLPLPESYKYLLSKIKEKYFCAIFDDQPIIGLTNDFLFAACRLLDDFASKGISVLFEYPSDIKINKEDKMVFVNLNSLEVFQKRVKPLMVVKYGRYSFAIVVNYHYGFFFNNMIADRLDYERRLEWYLENVPGGSTASIELAGMRRRGPVFNYLAIPLDVFMCDFDFSHTEESTRAVSAKNNELFIALRSGFILNKN